MGSIMASQITSGLQSGNLQTAGGVLNQYGAGPFPGSGESKIESEVQALAGKKHWKNVGFDVNGHFISSTDFNKMTDQQKQALQAMVATGSAKVANADKKGHILQEGTLLDLQGQHKAQMAIDAQHGGRNAVAQSITIEFGDQAKALLKVMNAMEKNPGQFIHKVTTRHGSTNGNSPNIPNTTPSTNG